MTDRYKSTVALPHSGTASDQTNDEQKSSDCYNNHSRDEGVCILKEVVVVVVCDEDISPDVTQDPSSSLERKKIQVCSK